MLLQKPNKEIALTNIIQKEVESIAKKNNDIVSAAFGGSFARGFWTPKSDIDLMVISKSGDPGVASHFQKLIDRLTEEHNVKLDIFVYPKKEIEWASKHSELSLKNRLVEKTVAKYRKVTKTRARVDGVRENTLNRIKVIALRKKVYNMLRRAYHPFYLQLWKPILDKDNFIAEKQQRQKELFDIPLIFQEGGIKKAVEMCRKGEMQPKELWNMCRNYDFWELVNYIKKIPK